MTFSPLQEVGCEPIKNDLKKKHINILVYTNLIQLRVAWGAGAYPSGHRVRGGLPVHHRATQRQTTTLTPKDNLESAVNLTCMFLDGGRNPENPRIHGENMSTEKEQGGDRTWNPLL